MVKIILIQPLPASRLDSRENLDRALRLLNRCRGQNADLICFPEYFPFWGEEEMARAARDLQAYVVAGLVAEERGKRYNTATLFDRQGKLVGRQPKVNPGKLERRAFGVTPGDSWQSFDTDFGRVGLIVCIDFWGRPEGSRELVAQGVDLIVNPSYFPVMRRHWLMASLARAWDYYLPVVGINTATYRGEIGGRQYPLQGGWSFAIQPPAPDSPKELSDIVRPWDDLCTWATVQKSEQEEIFSVSLDLEGARKWRPVIQERFFGWAPPS
ncbi:MAG: carbon-nitrogen hydrolase family protein [Deltaproteobacteria bacterium]|nr:carbon-nitrogen hydrolase family protein [Deltaproteobacteria bacterium]